MNRRLALLHAWFILLSEHLVVSGNDPRVAGVMSFEIEKTVQTNSEAKTCPPDPETEECYLIPAEQTAAAAPGERGRIQPNSFTILVAGK